MVKVRFLLDKEKDAYSNWKTATTKTEFGDFRSLVPPPIASLSANSSYQASKKDILRFLATTHRHPVIDVVLGGLRDGWNQIEGDFIRRLENMTNRRFPFRRVNGYLSTITKCPYNPIAGWFMVSVFSPIPRAMVNIAHELFHIHFHHHYGGLVAERIGQEKLGILKEALTVLLNVEFSDLFLLSDDGYPQHRDLRRLVVKEWRKHHDFDLLISRLMPCL